MCIFCVPPVPLSFVFQDLMQTQILLTSCWNRFVASLLASCDNAVPTTCQQVVFAIGLYIASLLISCDNAVLQYI